MNAAGHLTHESLLALCLGHRHCWSTGLASLSQQYSMCMLCIVCHAYWYTRLQCCDSWLSSVQRTAVVGRDSIGAIQGGDFVQEGQGGASAMHHWAALLPSIYIRSRVDLNSSQLHLTDVCWPTCLLASALAAPVTCLVVQQPIMHHSYNA